MTIAIGTAMGTGQGADGQQASTSTTITINDFSRDRTLFDSDFVNGGNSAVVTLSGTASIDEEIQARAVSIDDGGLSSTSWTDISTADGNGDWSGTMAVPRSGSFYRAQVRIKNEPVVLGQTTNSFGVGHVIAFWGQSEDERFHSSFYDQTIVPAVLDDNAVQYFYSDDVLQSGPILTHISNATPLTSAVAHLANTLISARPNEKFALIAQTRSGSDPRELVNDGDAGRNWSDDLALHQFATADGQKVGVATMSWFAAPGTLGANYGEVLFPLFTDKRLDGTSFAVPGDLVYSGGSVHYDHTFSELYDPTYTKWLAHGPHRFDISQDMQNATQILGGATDTVANTLEQARQSWRDMVSSPHTTQFLPMGFEMLTYQNGVSDGAGSWTDISHPAGDTEDGLVQRAKLFANVLLQGMGFESWTVPEFDNCVWESSGSFVEVWSSAGAITTTRNERGDAALGNEQPHWTDVVGWQINGQPAERAELEAGRVRIYPNGGGSFVSTDTIAFGQGRASGAVKFPEDLINELWKNAPIVDLGLYGIEGAPIKTLPDDAILANTLVPTNVFFTTSTAGPWFEAPTNIPASTSAICVSGEVNIPSATLSWDSLFTFTSTTFDLAVKDDGTVVLTLEDSTGAKMANSLESSAGMFPLNTFVEFEATADLAAGWFKLRLDGVEVWEVTFSSSTGQFSSSRNCRLLYKNSTSNQLVASVKFLRLWYEGTADGSAPVTQPSKEVSGAAANVNSDSWKQGADAT